MNKYAELYIRWFKLAAGNGTNPLAPIKPIQPMGIGTQKEVKTKNNNYGDVPAAGQTNMNADQQQPNSTQGQGQQAGQSIFSQPKMNPNLNYNPL